MNALVREPNLRKHTRILAQVMLAATCWIGCALSLDDIGAFPCATNNECPSGFACASEKGCVKDLAAALPFSCSKDGKCPGDYKCASEKGCVKDLAAALPFSCSKDGKCGGYLCKDGTCVVPSTGSPCVPDDAEGVSCKLGGAGLVCTDALDACANSCTDDRECSSAESCTLGVCLKKCSTLADCPLKVRCEDTYFNRKVCANVTFTSCNGTTLTACNGGAAWNCAAEAAGVNCGDNTTCPTNTTCLGSKRCSLCPSGYTATTCSTGLPCGNACGAGTWGCKPNTATAPTCNQALAKGWQGTCNCQNGTKITVGCTETDSCGNLCAAATKSP